MAAKHKSPRIANDIPKGPPSVPAKALPDKAKARPKSIPETAKGDHSAHAIVFNFARLDLEAPFGAAAGMTGANMPAVFEFFKSYSSKKWPEVAKEVHGKQGKSKHHYIAIEDLTPQAKKRYAELFGDEGSDFFFSLRRDGKFRLFGLRIDGVFFVMWWDVTHEQVCLSTLKNT